jgi:hypothetical protein
VSFGQRTLCVPRSVPSPAATSERLSPSIPLPPRSCGMLSLLIPTPSWYSTATYDENKVLGSAWDADPAVECDGSVATRWVHRHQNPGFVVAAALLSPCPRLSSVMPTLYDHLAQVLL